MPNPSPIKLLATNFPNMLRPRIHNLMRQRFHSKPSLQKQTIINNIRPRRNRFRTSIRLNQSRRKIKMLRRRLMRLRGNSMGNSRATKNRTQRRRIHPVRHRAIRLKRTIPPRSIHLHANKLRRLRNPTNRRPKTRQLLGSKKLSTQQILRHITSTPRTRELIRRTNHKSPRLATILTRLQRLLAKLSRRNRNRPMGTIRKKRKNVKRRRRNILLRSKLLLHPITRLPILRKCRKQLLLRITIRNLLHQRKPKIMLRIRRRRM